VNNSERSIVANRDLDRSVHADSNGLGDDELDDRAWAAAIAQGWAADLADSRQDIYSLEDGDRPDGADLRPPSPETTANEGRQ
jgi:hypothetical protein